MVEWCKKLPVSRLSVQVPHALTPKNIHFASLHIVKRTSHLIFENPAFYLKLAKDSTTSQRILINIFVANTSNMSNFVAFFSRSNYICTGLIIENEIL